MSQPYTHVREPGRHWFRVTAGDFTLIELLMVAGITALLISIVVSSLSRAPETQAIGAQEIFIEEDFHTYDLGPLPPPWEEDNVDWDFEVRWNTSCGNSSATTNLHVERRNPWGYSPMSKGAWLDEVHPTGNNYEAVIWFFLDVPEPDVFAGAGIRFSIDPFDEDIYHRAGLSLTHWGGSTHENTVTVTTDGGMSTKTVSEAEAEWGLAFCDDTRTVELELRVRWTVVDEENFRRQVFVGTVGQSDALVFDRVFSKQDSAFREDGQYRFGVTLAELVDGPLPEPPSHITFFGVRSLD